MKTTEFTIPAPARHHHVIALISNQGKDANKGIQGFITDQGKFLNRIKAAKYVLDIGQIKKLNWAPNLYSEDLW